MSEHNPGHYGINKHETYNWFVAFLKGPNLKIVLALFIFFLFGNIFRKIKQMRHMNEEGRR